MRIQCAAIAETRGLSGLPVLAGLSTLMGLSAFLGLSILLGCGREEPSSPSGALEATEIDLAPAIGGRALEVRVRLGDRVAAGDTLVVLDTDLLALQREQSVAALASVRAQQSAAGDELQAAERNLALAETTLQRLRALQQQGSATQQQLDDVGAGRDVAASQVSAARHRMAVYQAEQERIGAAIAVDDRRLEDGVLLAPGPGTVLVRALEPGEMAAAGVPVVRLADLSRLDLRIYLEAESLVRVRLGQEVQLRIDGLGDEGRAGRVVWISDEAEFTPKNAQTRDARAQLVYAVKVEIPNSDGRLHIGMTAEAEI
ncbi:MAG: efflux RND transporter periplasmic adaptor subunit [Candidatus Eisenbacteria bacterium]